MSAENSSGKPSFLISLFQNKCTRCRRGKLYKYGSPYELKRFMVMNDQCPVCGQPLDMEPGFYYGTNMVSYTIAVLICAITFFLWWLTIGFSLSDKRFFWWIGANALLLVILQPPLMRLSRTVWLSFFVPYSSKWAEGDVVQPERINKDQQHNW